MTRLALAALVLASLAASACRKPMPKSEPRPDYDGVKARSEGSHKSLDKETGD